VLVEALGWVDPGATRPLRLIPTTLVIFGVLVFTLAVSLIGVYRGLRELHLWGRHRRGIRELEPLWQLLTSEFPEFRLPGVHDSGWFTRDPLAPQRVHRCYYRRLVEIRDGPVRLTPYYDADVAQAAEELARA
jgi:hypothetical protein